MSNEPWQSHILPLAALAERRSAWRRDGRRVVLVHGLFDLLRPGHVQALERAKEHGDVLLLSLRPDVDPGWERRRTTLDQRVRAMTLASLPSVDFVTPVDAWSAVESIRALTPDVFVQGVDGPGRAGERDDESREKAEAVACGSRIVTIDDPMIHEGENRPIGESPAEEADTFLKSFRARHQARDVIAILKALRRLKVLVVGDTIIDEFHFCRPYGMPVKSPIIAAQFLQGEAHAGGILAVANHLAGFCDTVHLVTCLGAADSREDFVRGHLRPNVRPDLFLRPDGPTMVKRRYLQNFMARSLFELSFFNDAPLPGELDREITARLGGLVADCDLVVVADFGQGFMSPNIIDRLARGARFLAVNSQTNSVNYGFNVITKYPRVDYACIDQHELRMAVRDRQRPAEDLIPMVAEQLGAAYVAVTMGHHGCLTQRRGMPGVMVPVLSRDVVDTIGAGDAFLSLTAPCAALGVEPDVLGFIGNAVGALAVRFIGNQQSIRPEPLFEFIEGIL